MKKPVSTKMNFEDEVSDSLSTSAPNSSHAYQDDNASPFLFNRNNQLSDSESLSDSSKKIRKKREGYCKIADDIRIQLLEAVQNGETLKAAAKRHNINYSSAKSILHTYRKEGRILKKSAHERSTKKRSEASELGSTPKATKMFKKENSEPVYKHRNGGQQLDSFVKKSAPPKGTSVPQNNFNQEGNISHMYPPMTPMSFQQRSSVEVADDFLGSLDPCPQNNDHYDNFYMNNFEPTFENQVKESFRSQTQPFYCDPNDFLSFHNEDKTSYIDNRFKYEEKNEDSLSYPYSNFATTQDLFKDAFRKISLCSNESDPDYKLTGAMSFI